jgi:hypothetical protein
MRPYLAAAVVMVALSRLAWLAGFVVLAARGPTWRSRIAALRAAAVRSDQYKGNQAVATALYNQFKAQQSTMYTLGGLTLAAWSIVGATAPDDHDGRFALGMLSVAVIAAFLVPATFRVAGSAIGRIGYESGLSVVAISVLAAVATLVHRSFSGVGVEISLFVAVGIALVRDFLELRLQAMWTWRELRPRPQPDPAVPLSG